jgi:hypothetical protein
MSIWKRRRRRGRSGTRGETHILYVDPVGGLVVAAALETERVLSRGHVHLDLGVDGRRRSRWKELLERGSANSATYICCSAAN